MNKNWEIYTQMLRTMVVHVVWSPSLQHPSNFTSQLHMRPPLWCSYAREHEHGTCTHFHVPNYNLQGKWDITPTYMIVKMVIHKCTWTIIDGNRCILHAIQRENSPPSNQLPPFYRKIWKPYCLHCWWANDKERHPATCMWWRGRPTKTSCGTHTVTQQPSKHTCR